MITILINYELIPIGIIGNNAAPLIGFNNNLSFPNMS